MTALVAGRPGLEPAGGPDEARAGAPAAGVRDRVAVAAGTVLVLTGMVLMTRAGGRISALTAWGPAWVAGLPLVAVGLRVRGEGVVRAVLAVSVVLAGLFVADALTATGAGVDDHDGGVWVTAAASDVVARGQNPYTADFTDALPPEWQLVPVPGRDPVVNPLHTTYPYLPAAFLAHVPGRAVAGAGSPLADPRVVMTATYVLALVAVARWAASSRARVAALLAAGGPLVLGYLAHGTNDAWAASLVVLAAAAATRWPRAAGAALAVAISIKALVVVAVVPFGLWAWRRGGWAGLRRWWTVPATLALTVAPFLVADPGALMADTVLFWAGASDASFPPSGYGLPVRFPGVVHGPVQAALTVLGAVAGLAGAVAVVRRAPGAAALPLATAVAVAGLVVPATTFQANYLVLLAVLASTGWLLVDRRRGDEAAPDGGIGA